MSFWFTEVLCVLLLFTDVLFASFVVIYWGSLHVCNIVVHRGSFCIIVVHSKVILYRNCGSLRFTLYHCGTLRLCVYHCGPLMINVYHCGSLRFILYHCVSQWHYWGSLRFNTYHCGSFRLIVYQCGSLRLSVYHRGSVRFTMYHCGSLGFSVYHCGSQWYCDSLRFLRIIMVHLGQLCFIVVYSDIIAVHQCSLYIILTHIGIIAFTEVFCGNCSSLLYQSCICRASSWFTVICFHCEPSLQGLREVSKEQE